MNPLFYIVFICPVVTLPLATILNYNLGSFWVFDFLLAATIIYLSGSFLITILGNIPINNVLHKRDLEGFSNADARALRNDIETKWNTFNLVRTVTSSIAFILLIMICLLMIL